MILLNTSYFYYSIGNLIMSVVVNVITSLLHYSLSSTNPITNIKIKIIVIGIVSDVRSFSMVGYSFTPTSFRLPPTSS